MKIMVIGSGGREHALIKKIKENKKVEKIYALPGNGGISRDAECVPIDSCDIKEITKFAVDNKIDFAVVAPDDPLVLGAVDSLEEAGIKCFGPNKKAAIIEGSKAFSKSLMRKYKIPTAEYDIFEDVREAISHVEKADLPLVVKADGLALGKGVIIAETLMEAKEAVKSIMEDKIFGRSGNTIVVEDFLTGPEVSVLAFTDGKTIVPMVSSMDHKRAMDNDEGLNTGGMGTIAPNPCYTPEIARECMETIFIPTVNAMNAEGRTFKGCLYFGLMLTPNGPKVIEYNCRFGDPETQVVLPLLKTDLLEIMMAVRDERLSEINVEFDTGAACCVIAASGGYPIAYKKGFDICEKETDCTIYHAGTALKDGRLVTSGGRVLGVTATAKNLKEAVEKAYKGIESVNFEGMFYRRDIGQRALKYGKE